VATLNEINWKSSQQLNPDWAGSATGVDVHVSIPSLKMSASTVGGPVANVICPAR
jgi:hypothetical protein